MSAFGKALCSFKRPECRRMRPVCSCITEQTGGSGGGAECLLSPDEIRRAAVNAVDVHDKLTPHLDHFFATLTFRSSELTASFKLLELRRGQHILDIGEGELTSRRFVQPCDVLPPRR